MCSIKKCSDIKGKNNMVLQDRDGITFALIFKPACGRIPRSLLQGSLQKIERWIVVHAQISVFTVLYIGIFCFGVGRNLDVCSGEPPVI